MADVKAPLVSLSDHPRASRSIRQIKAWGGLIGFAAVGGYGYMSGLGIADALLRGVIAGVLAQVLAWAAAIVFWQHVLDGETRSVIRRSVESRRADAQARQPRNGDR